MAIPDTKRCQTYINELARQAAIVREAVAAMKAMRVRFVTASPSTVDTARDGNADRVSTALDALDTAISASLWTRIIAARVETHEGRAL